MGHHFLLQGIFPAQGPTQVSCIAGRLFTFWVTREGIGPRVRVKLTGKQTEGLKHARRLAISSCLTKALSTDPSFYLDWNLIFLLGLPRCFNFFNFFQSTPCLSPPHSYILIPVYSQSYYFRNGRGHDFSYFKTFIWIFSRLTPSYPSDLSLNVTSSRKPSQIPQSESFLFHFVDSHHFSNDSFRIVLIWTCHVLSSFCFHSYNLSLGALCSHFLWLFLFPTRL